MQLRSLLTATLLSTLFFQTTQAQNSSPYWSLAGNSNASSSSKLGTTNSDPLNLTTNNVTRLRIGTDGKVGIGTTNPQQLFHVEGQTLLSIFVSTTAPSSISGSGMIGYVKALPTAAGQRLGYFLLGSRGGAENNYNAAGMVGYASGSWSSSSHPAYLTFETTPSGSATRSERMRIDQNGNVGIGTTSPSAKLDVAGGSSNYAINATTTGNYGVYSTANYMGVYGQGNSYGVYGYSGNGFGVSASSTNNWGVYAYGANGIYGASNGSNSSYGVEGVSNSTSGSAGVYGFGYYGVQGVSTSGYGVDGTGYYVGVVGHGSTSNTYSYGIEGYGNDVGGYTNGSNIGIEGAGNYGVYGYGGSYGVYGYNSTSGGYAGYFSGNVYSTGTYYGSDRRLKKNITDFTSAIELISKLQPKQYEYRQDGNYKLMNLPEGTHYGLIAQDLEQVLPTLVKDTKFDVSLAKKAAIKPEPGKVPAPQQAESIDFKAVNYTELIPILVKGMQEQQAEIEALKNEISQLKQGGSNVTSMGALNQATPNPAQSNTRISYRLPAGVTQAQLLVTDAAGKTIKAISLNGSGNVNVNTAALSSGVYNYSLLINGNVVETKKLVVAR